jgi:hypothetical protein
MNLSEFLLARIAEDEAATFELVPYRCEPGCCAPAGWVGHRCLICGTEEFGGTVEAITDIAREHDEQIHRRTRVLAECESKRQIAKDGFSQCGGYGEGDHPHYPDPGWSFCDGCAAAASSDSERAWVLRLLALPYADHEQFQEEWRV